MTTEAIVLLILDLAGTFAFALNGALTAMKSARVDIVGVLVLGLITAVGGGTVRDILLDRLPPATFTDWRYLSTAAVGALVAFFTGRYLERVFRSIMIFDAIGLSFFAVNGALTALMAGVGPVQAAILGVVTAVGGGTIRDVLVRRVPSVLSSGFYAIPAAVGASLGVLFTTVGLSSWPWLLVAAAVCLVLRLLGVRLGFRAPMPPAPAQPVSQQDSE